MTYGGSMKLTKQKITSDTHTTTDSTTFYAATLNQVVNTFKSSDTNVWIQKSFTELGWDAIDFKNNLYGSHVVDDILYICVTNGYDVDVNGQTVNPEELLVHYTPDEVSDYIKPATDSIIQKYITEYEIHTPLFDDWAVDMLKSGIPFSELVRDFQDFQQ